LKPSGRPVRTYDYTPHAGARDFDDSSWTALDAETLEQRRGNGKLSFNWYRIQQFQLAVFGMNGPISASPSNFIWIKEATLDFYKPEPTATSSSAIPTPTPSIVGHPTARSRYIAPRAATAVSTSAPTTNRAPTGSRSTPSVV
jgi:hypothetical protein